MKKLCSDAKIQSTINVSGDVRIQLRQAKRGKSLSGYPQHWTLLLLDRIIKRERGPSVSRSAIVGSCSRLTHIGLCPELARTERRLLERIVHEGSPEEGAVALAAERLLDLAKIRSETHG